ncbi:MAG: Transcriptional regulator, IclR family, partial [uncultured Pseudonocardia sp.]
ARQGRGGAARGGRGTVRTGRAVRAHRAAPGHGAPARRGTGGARAAAPRLRRALAPGPHPGRAGDGR